MSLALVSTPLAGWRTSAQSLLCDISQITFTSGGGNSSLALSDDGAHIAFLSNRDLAGGNADGNFEIFLYNMQAGSFTQLTDSTEELSFVNFDLSIGGDGTRIAFKSTLDLTGGNADRNSEIFFFDTGTSSFTQVTHTTGFGESDDPALSDDGTRLAFRSSHDLTGGNPDGNQEIFLYNTQTGSFTQLTNTTWINNFNPAISGNGTRIAFESNRDLTGGNPDLNFEIFLTTCRLDNDDDGIPDDSDPDTVADVVIALPDTNFQSSGNKNAFLNRLDAIDQLILDGKIEQALQELQNLRKRVDGCGSTADTNDWITDCGSQLQVRALIDMLIANLSS